MAIRLWKGLLIISYVVLSHDVITVNVAISENTPSEIRDSLCSQTNSGNSNLGAIRIQCIDLSSDQTTFGTHASITEPDLYKVPLVFDALYSTELSYLLNSGALAFKVPIVLISGTACRLSKITQYYAFPSVELEVEAMAKVVELWDWNPSFGVYGIDPASLYFHEQQQLLSSPKENIYTSKISQASINNRVARVIKPLGIRFGLLALPAAESRLVLKALSTNHIAGSGYVFLLQARSAWFETSEAENDPIFRDGLLVISQLGMEDIKSETEFIQRTCCQLLQSLTNLEGNVEQFLTQNFVFRPGSSVACRRTQFGLFNLQNGKYVQVGGITQNKTGEAIGVSIFDEAEIIYPGSTTAPPIHQKAVIQFSMNRGLFNFGHPPSYSFEVLYRGSDIAVEHIASRDDILPNHKFVRYDYSSGAGNFHYDYAIEHLSEVKASQNFGISTIASVTSSCTIGLLTALQDLEVDVPVLGGGSLASQLSSAENFPSFLRLSVTVYYDVHSLISFFKFNKWKKFGIIYQLDTFGIDGYKTWMEMSKSQGFECLNNPSYHGVDFNVTNPEEIREQAEELINSKSRIVVMIGLWRVISQMFEMLHDLGAKAGQFQIILIGSAEKEMIDGDLEPEVYEKRKEIAGGMLYLRYAVYRGEIGEQLVQLGEYTTTPFHCSYYDATFLTANVAHSMMALGKEFEDPQSFKSFAQTSRFTGCQGILIFEGNGSNNRRPYSYDVVNLQQDALDEWDLVQVGKYQPGSSIAWVFDKPIQWTDPSVTVLLDYIETETFSCGFNTDDLQPLSEGYIILGCAGAVAILLCLGAIYKSRWRWNYLHIHPLDEHKKQSTNDVLLLIGFGVEFVQLCGMCPGGEKLNLLMYQLGQATILNLGSIADMGDSNFTVQLSVVAFVSMSFVVFAFVFLKRIDLKFNHWCCINLGFYGENLLPFFSSFCYVPIISSLLQVFKCTRSLDGSIENSYLDVSCDYQCWSPDHLILVAFSGYCMLIFVPIAVTTRPIWQNYMLRLHILIRPRFQFIRSLLQTGVLVTYLTVRELSPMAVTSANLAVFTAYLVYSLKIDEFNYKRSWVGHVMSVACLVWHAILCLLALLLDFDVELSLAHMIGLGTIFSLSYLVMIRRYRQMLFSEKYDHWNTLYKFGLTN